MKSILTIEPILLLLGGSILFTKNAVLAQLASTPNNQQALAFRGSTTQQRNHMGHGNNNETIPSGEHSEMAERHLWTNAFGILISKVDKGLFELTINLPTSHNAEIWIEFVDTIHNVKLSSSPAAKRELLCPGVECYSGRNFVKRFGRTWASAANAIPPGPYHARLVTLDPITSSPTIWAHSELPNNMISTLLPPQVWVTHCTKEPCTKYRSRGSTAPIYNTCSCGSTWTSSECYSIGFS